MVEYGEAGQAYKLEGARRLRATLRKAGDDLSDLKAANLKAANIVAPVARNRAPRKRGRLEQTVRPGATKTAAIIRAGNNAKAGVAYANPIHWGWFARHIKPTLFLSRAAQESENQWIVPYEQALDNAVQKIEGASP